MKTLITYNEAIVEVPVHSFILDVIPASVILMFWVLTVEANYGFDTFVSFSKFYESADCQEMKQISVLSVANSCEVVLQKETIEESSICTLSTHSQQKQHPNGATSTAATPF